MATEVIAADGRLERSTLKRALTQLALPAGCRCCRNAIWPADAPIPDAMVGPRSDTCRRAIRSYRSMRRVIAYHCVAVPSNATNATMLAARMASAAMPVGGRGEWVSRWVLNNGQSTRQVQREVSDETFGSGVRDNHGLGTRWIRADDGKRLMDEAHWTEIELLEDLRNAVRWIDCRTMSGNRCIGIRSPVCPTHYHHVRPCRRYPLRGETGRRTHVAIKHSRICCKANRISGTRTRETEGACQGYRCGLFGSDRFLTVQENMAKDVDADVERPRHAPLPPPRWASVARARWTTMEPISHARPQAAIWPGIVDEEGDTSMGDETPARTACRASRIATEKRRRCSRSARSNSRRTTCSHRHGRPWSRKRQGHLGGVMSGMHLMYYIATIHLHHEGKRGEYRGTGAIREEFCTWAGSSRDGEGQRQCV